MTATYAEWRRHRFEALARRLQRVARWLPNEFSEGAVDWVRLAGASGSPEAMSRALHGLDHMRKCAAKERWPLTVPQKQVLGEVRAELERFQAGSTAFG